MKLHSNQTIVKINKENQLSVLDLGLGSYEVAHIRNGEVCYDVFSDVMYISPRDLDEDLQEMVADVIDNILEKEYQSSIIEGAVVINSFTYEIWVDVVVYDFKVCYNVATIHSECEEDYKDKNIQVRKTWNGLVNYINRYDK